MVKAMCGVHLNDRKRAVGLNDTIDLLVIASSVRWYGHVDGHSSGRHALRLKVRKAD